ncbi:MAG: hypothetical protein ACRDZO_19555 [Egibacteraceae bacterium]
MNVPDSSKPITPGTWRRAAEIDAGLCRSTTPCCDQPTTVALDELSQIGYVTLRCPTCDKPWDLHYDPWTPAHDALWIE